MLQLNAYTNCIVGRAVKRGVFLFVCFLGWFVLFLFFCLFSNIVQYIMINIDTSDYLLKKIDVIEKIFSNFKERKTL